MIKEEAISVLEQAELKVGIKWRNGRPEVYISPYLQEAIDFALTKLHPINRVQVEKVWRGEWIDGVCQKCGFDAMYYKDVPVQVYTKFCPNCGAPMTDEAVEMVMDRLEGIK